MATQVMINDAELEKYLDDVAKANGGMGRATAARFIIAEHRRVNSEQREEQPAQANQPAADKEQTTTSVSQ